MDPELGLRNPYSKITCIVLYYYSMEFGNPPLYAEVNRVSRDQDFSQLNNLGPFLRALGAITARAEGYRHADDKIKTGANYTSGSEFNIAGIFLLFRGVQMKDEQLDPYEQNLYSNTFDEGERKGKPISLKTPCYLSCSRKPKEALKFAFQNLKPDHIPILLNLYLMPHNIYSKYLLE